MPILLNLKTSVGILQISVKYIRYDTLKDKTESCIGIQGEISPSPYFILQETFFFLCDKGQDQVKPALFSFSQEIKERGNKLQLDYFLHQRDYGRVLKEFCCDYIFLGKREIRLMRKLKIWFVKYTLKVWMKCYAHYYLFPCGITGFHTWLHRTVEPTTKTTKSTPLVVKWTEKW